MAPRTRRRSSSRSTGPSCSPSRWPSTEVPLPLVHPPPSTAQHPFFPLFSPPAHFRAPNSCCLLSCSRALLAELQGGVRQLERAAPGPQQGHPHGHQGGGGQAARHPADVRPGLQHPLPAADRQRPGHLSPHYQHVSGEPAAPRLGLYMVRITSLCLALPLFFFF